MEFFFDIYAFITGTINRIARDVGGGDGAAVGFIAATLMVGVAAALRNYPLRIYQFIRGRILVTIQTNDSWNYDNREIFQAVCDFISLHQMNRANLLVRADVKQGKNGDVDVNMITGPFRPSSGMFFVGLRPFWFSFTEAKEQGSVPETVSLSTPGRKLETIWDAINLHEGLRKTWSKRRFYESVGNDWVAQGTIEVDAPIFLEDDVKEQVDAKIKFFQENAQWCMERGINHKLSFLLHGAPGTGKSALGRYVANRLGWSYGTSSATISNVKGLVRTAAQKEIVMSIPELDTLGLADNRELPPEYYENKKKAAGKPGGQTLATAVEPEVLKQVNKLREALGQEAVFNPDPINSDTFDEKGNMIEGKEDETKDIDKLKYKDGFGLGIMLNLLQGDLPLNNSVIMFSTNDLNAIDPAFYRPGRIELVLEVKAMRYKSSNQFYQHYYSTKEDLGEEFKTLEIRACDIMDLFTNNKHDPEAFKQGLLQYTEVANG